MYLQFGFLIFCRKEIACKSLCKMLVKLTQGVNFINILCAPFCVKVFCAAFLLLHFGFVVFWQKNISTKATCKMLVKLTTGRH